MSSSRMKRQNQRRKFCLLFGFVTDLYSPDQSEFFFVIFYSSHWSANVLYIYKPVRLCYTVLYVAGDDFLEVTVCNPNLIAYSSHPDFLTADISIRFVPCTFFLYPRNIESWETHFVSFLVSKYLQMHSNSFADLTQI